MEYPVGYGNCNSGHDPKKIYKHLKLFIGLLRLLTWSKERKNSVAFNCGCENTGINWIPFQILNFLISREVSALICNKAQMGEKPPNFVLKV